MTIYAHVSLDEKRKALRKLGGGAGLTRLLSPLLSNGLSALCARGICAGQEW